jgi:hypothetical protein
LPDWAAPYTATTQSSPCGGVAARGSACAVSYALPIRPQDAPAYLQEGVKVRLDQLDVHRPLGGVLPED